jgi:ubiquinone/menaquinone biosynthesis C-methylase UbiE
MDVLTALDAKADYSTPTLQLIVGAWVLSGVAERKKKISLEDGDVSEDDYDKQSIYSLLYALYRSCGEIQSDTGARYEVTFNTWGYQWPEDWGPAPTGGDDPQRFGKYAYTGLFASKTARDYIDERGGAVHVVEMGSGTGAGAHHVCKEVLKRCTWEAIDTQEAAIQTCRRKHCPELDGRLKATRADATKVEITDESADFVAVCETHVTEMPGVVTDEDRRFFGTARRLLKPGGFLTWGNAIPDLTWKPCFDYLRSIGFEMVEERDVTKLAVEARDRDAGRVNAFIEQCLARFVGFRIPVLGRKKRVEADAAMRNFYRNPGTKLYANMVDGTDTYRVVLFKRVT